MAERLTPHPAQEVAIEHIVANPRTLLMAGTGAGKSLVGVEAALRTNSKVVLVCAPLNTFRGWERTFALQTEGLAELRWINSKKAGQEALRDLLKGIEGYYFIGSEYLRSFGWQNAPIDFFICDEAHRFANRKAVGHTILKTIPFETRFLMLSATPFANKLENAWAQSRVLWPKETPRSFWSWVTTYLKTEKDPYTYLKVSGELNPGALWDSLPSAIKMPSVYMAEPVIHEVEVDLAPAQRKHYKELLEDALTWLADNPLAPELPAVKHMRLLQMTLGVPSIKQDWIRRQDPETGEWYKEWGDKVIFEDNCKSSKIDALLEILSDLYAGGESVPVVVYTHSRQFATVVTKRLQAKGYEARQFVGGMDSDERIWKLDNFGVEYDIMVATIPAVAEGVDSLKDNCHNEIWLSHSENPLLNVQAKGRLSRQGQTKTVNRWVIRARDTIEITKQLGRLQLNEDIMAESLG